MRKLDGLLTYFRMGKIDIFCTLIDNCNPEYID